MGDVCGIGSCRIRRAGQETIPLFRFPKNEKKREKWTKAIRQFDQSFLPKKSTRICGNHFEESDLIHVGKKTFVRKDAYPSKLGEIKIICPPSPPPVPEMDDVEREQCEIEQLNRKLLQEDILTLFEKLREDLHSKLNFSPFQLNDSDENVTFYILDTDSEAGIKFKVRVVVQKNMAVKVYIYENEVPKSEVQVGCMSLVTMKITTWSQLENILIKFRESHIFEETPEMRISKAILQLRSINDEDILDHRKGLISIITNQLENILAKRPRYNKDTILFSFLLFTQSSSTYDQAKTQMILPHPNYLRYISSNLSVSTQDNDNKTYLKNVANHLEDIDKKVAILIDGIHIKEGITYKCSKISGLAENNSKIAAKQVQVFMIASVFGKFKEIVNFMPTKKVTGEDLHERTSNVIKFVQEDLGLEVVAIITDNFSANVNMFEIFSRDDVWFTNPQLPSKKIFLLFDTVHLFKNIRNNWLTKKRTFIFPDFETMDQEMEAKLDNVRQFYHEEADKVLRKTHKLTFETLYPNPLERQKVVLVDNLFHPSTISAIRERFEDTAAFMILIRKWWSIMNVGSKFKGIRFRDPDANPITSTECENFIFLQKFTKWVEQWKILVEKLKLSEGCLTNQTYKALVWTNKAVMEFCKYAFQTFGVEYILLRKLQTDKLENRFSQYRRLSGCNYNVSFVQIMETEKKIRLRKVVKNQWLDEFKKDKDAESENYPENPEETYNIMADFQGIFDMDYLSVHLSSPVDKGVALYAAGYACRQLTLRIDCESCREIFVENKGGLTDSEYFNYFQRGGLLVPTDRVIFALNHMCSIFAFILNDSNLLDSFIKSKNQRLILSQLTLESIKGEGFFYFYVDKTCEECNNENEDLYKIILNPMANILIKSYAKSENDKIKKAKFPNKEDTAENSQTESQTSSRGKRKFGTQSQNADNYSQSSNVSIVKKRKLATYE